MKKLLALLALSTSLMFLTACSNTTQLNVSTGNETIVRDIGTGSLIEIGGDVYYDSYTNIVYFWNGSDCGQTATMPSAYFAPNGLPYKYNPKSNTLEELGVDER